MKLKLESFKQSLSAVRMKRYLKQAGKYIVGKNLTDFTKFMLFYIREIKFPSRLGTSFFQGLFFGL